MNLAWDRAKQIQCLICDIDGVLTDGLLYLDNQGNESKTFHIHDGVGLKLIMAAGIHVAVITGSKNQVVDHRMNQLGISLYYKNQLNKLEVYDHIKKTLQVDDAQIAYIGDDLPDLPLIKKVGLGATVADAIGSVKEYAIWKSQYNGGRGAVRELCEFILNSQNKMQQAMQEYLKL